MRASSYLFCAVLVAAAPAAPCAEPWELAPQPPVEKTSDDLHRAHARLLARSGQPLAALARLRRFAAARGPLAARLYAQFGMTAAARTALAGAAYDPNANRAWLALAHASMAVGDAAGAVSALASMPVQLDLNMGLRRARLLARALLALDRPDEAALALTAERERQDLPQLARYDLGIALIRAESISRGIALLDALGAYTGADIARKALADQANLALGYWFLDQNRGAYARRTFLRVRLDTPVTRKAMLGLGWAEISAGGLTQALLTSELQDCLPADSQLWTEAEPLHQVPRLVCRRREFDGDRRLLDAASLQTTAASQYTRAAIAWQAAAGGGNPGNPVVAEALASLPFALEVAGDAQAAEEAFKGAIAGLTEALEGFVTAPPAVPAVSPSAPLARLRAGLRRARQHLATRAATLGQALGPLPAAASDAVTRLGAVLDELRLDGGWSLQAPDAFQRGRLIVGLQAAAAAPRTAGVAPERLAALSERIGRLQTRIGAALTAIEDAAAAARQRRRTHRQEQIRRYLAQSRAGLAALHQQASQ